ncbi:C4-dicarboxylic acid transporter DauA [Polystyrenella longa]|uniref:C4-dicarboxylic acid transporter DauA n=1 Tax=Polystyrenella longa TaxID=2528007 RepID=A0A518CSI0_9PLAN|nr:SulP family inorganic anion transporter [Polystyrenella longa]QDU82191.1 C4-dicarboxylic acid transporter DauA [Polystyrenella longa]
MPTTSNNGQPKPKGNAAGFSQYFMKDLISGFLVFLIALPLCLGIASASGFPPIAGIFTAIIGALVTTFISNSELTIKGPAAGLIVIVIGCIEEFGGNGMTGGWTEADAMAYKAALAVGVVAAIFQILFGIFRAGILGEFFPASAVHGMLAAIGVIIIVKQIPVALGVAASGSPLHMMQEIPTYFTQMNPAIAAIGLTSIAIMFLWPLAGKQVSGLKKVPSPIIVLAVAIPMGMYFNLTSEHDYVLGSNTYHLDDHFLVDMPGEMFGMMKDITFPDFTALKQPFAWKWVFMFFIIGSLESLLSAKAVDLLDPWKRKTNLDRDMLAVGVGNCCAAFVGGLPMISEIVRSRANIDNGARTRFADMWHGLFLLLCVAFIPMFLHLIPNAALAAMLVYTGTRLAHPTEFMNVYRIGKEQLLIFVTTLVAVLATDLLIGIIIGILLKMTIHVLNGVALNSLFKPFLEVQNVDENTSLIVAHQSAVFSNWIPFRRQIEQIGLVQRRNLIIDVSNAKLVDHSVMEKLEEMEQTFEQEGLHFEVRGLDTLQPFTENAHAARKRGLATVKRITVVADESLREMLENEFVRCGATGYTTFPCTGKGLTQLVNDDDSNPNQYRIEVIVPFAVCETILGYLRTEVLPKYHVTTCVETVEVVKANQFAPVTQEIQVELITPHS